MLYNKYRPKNLIEFSGHDAIKNSVANMIATNAYPHAMLFVGGSGTGKTSLARIVAMGMNCLETFPVSRPCGTCQSCLASLSRSNPDLVEIDAASNNGVDNIRELREKANFMPVQMRNKIYIIDEFHMLTTQASNALLKTLEEPPSRCFFILCTTELDRVLPTIQSRCIKYHFGTLQPEQIGETLARVVSSEGFTIEQPALDLISSFTDGGLREAICRVEECINSLDTDVKQIDLAAARKACKTTNQDVIDVLINSLDSSRPDIALTVTEKLEKAGYNLHEVCLQLIGAMHKKLTAHYLNKTILVNPEFYINSIKILATAQQKMNNKLVVRSLFDVSMIECCTSKFK